MEFHTRHAPRHEEKQRDTLARAHVPYRRLRGLAPRVSGHRGERASRARRSSERSEAHHLGEVEEEVVAVHDVVGVLGRPEDFSTEEVVVDGDLGGERLHRVAQIRHAADRLEGLRRDSRPLPVLSFFR